MRNHTRRVAFGSIAATLVVAGVMLSGALATRRAARHAGFESAVLTRDIEYLEAKLASDSANWLIAGHLADLYMLRFQAEADFADVRRAEALARAAIPLRIDPAAGHARLSAILLAQHRFAEAHDAARTAVSVINPPASAMAAFVDAARARGDDAAADSMLARMDRNSFAASIRRADRFADAGQLRAAVRAVRLACARMEETGATRELRAWCYTKLASLEHTRQGPDAARAWLEHARAVQPAHRGAAELLANLDYARGRWRQARRIYERIATEAHPDLYLRLAEVTRALGDSDAALAYEQRFIQLASAPEAEALNALPLAIHLAQRRECKRAVSIAERELIRRRSAEALERIAWVRYRCGDHAGAVQALALAAAAREPSPSAQYLLGLLRSVAGDSSSAAAIIAGAISDPTQLEPHVLQHIREAS